MSDQLRETVRSAIAEMVAESPEPLAYERVITIGDRPAARRSVWALAAFLVVVVAVGAVALLRPLGDPVPPVADIPSITEDVAAAALPSVFVASARVPDGFGLVQAEREFGDAGTLLVYTPSGTDGGSSDTDPELLISTSTPRIPDFPPDIEVITQRLDAAYPNATITGTTVRGQPAFLIDPGGSETDGWTTALVAIEESGLISEVQGRHIDPGEILAVARGLVSVSREEFEQRAVEATDWDLRIHASTDKPDRLLDNLTGIPGVESITVSTLRLGGSTLALRIQSDPSQQVPTTTEPVATDPDPATTDPDPVILERIRVMVTLQGGTDPEAVSAAIHDLGDFVRVSYSPAIGATISQEYLETVLGDAQIIHQDPVIYQPLPGPQPGFDTSNLGTEVDLKAATASTVFSDSTLELIESSGRGLLLGADPTPGRGPIIHIGSVDDGTRLVLAFINDRDYLEMNVHGSGAGSGTSTLGAFYDYGETGGSSSGSRWHIRVRVPLETSVVVLELDNGTTLWQRPIAGYGLFPAEGPEEVRPSGTISALTANGTTIDRWRASS
jgi:hypothetical protein